MTNGIPMKCGLCAFEFEADVEVDPKKRGHSLMRRCTKCSGYTAEPTTRPYRLSLTDQRFLKGLRVGFDGEDCVRV